MTFRRREYDVMPNDRTKPKRHFLRFSIRTVLISLTICCVWLGWKVERARKQREVVAWVQGVGGTVNYESQSHGPQWLRKQIGRHFFDDVVSIDFGFMQLSDVTPLAELKNLKELVLSSTQMTDISPLAGLSNLESLNLTNTKVSDVIPLVELTTLEDLSLGGTKVRTGLVNLNPTDLP